MNKEKVKELAEKTKAIADIDEKLSVKKAEYELAIKDLVTMKALFSTEVTNLKKVLDVEALDEFKLTEAKKLYGGIGIKQYTVIEYDEEKALAWCKLKQLCLDMNIKAFDKLVPELAKDKTQGLEFVTFGKKNVVTYPAVYELKD